MNIQENTQVSVNMTAKNIVVWSLLLRSGTAAEYCDQPVCLSVCVGVCLSIGEHISGTARPIFRKFRVQIPCGCSSVLLRRPCDTLCTSGFMDDVTFGRNGRYHMAMR